MWTCPNCGANLDSASERCDCFPVRKENKYSPVQPDNKKATSKICRGADVKTLGTPIKSKNKLEDDKDFSSFFSDW